MAQALVDNWWTLVVRGLLALAFGIMTIIMPGLAATVMVLGFGAYAFVDGLFNLIAAFRRPAGRREFPWGVFFQGLAGIIAGLVTLFVPGITALVLLALIASWAILTGAFAIAVAITLRKTIDHEWMLALAGALSIVLGLLLVIFRTAGMLAVVLWIGIYVAVIGVLLIALGLKLRRRGRSPARPTPAVA